VGDGKSAHRDSASLPSGADFCTALAVRGVAGRSTRHDRLRGPGLYTEGGPNVRLPLYNSDGIRLGKAHDNWAGVRGARKPCKTIGLASLWRKLSDGTSCQKALPSAMQFAGHQLPCDLQETAQGEPGNQQSPLFKVVNLIASETKPCCCAGLFQANCLCPPPPPHPTRPPTHTNAHTTTLAHIHAFQPCKRSCSFSHICALGGGGGASVKVTLLISAHLEGGGGDFSEGNSRTTPGPCESF